MTQAPFTHIVRLNQIGAGLQVPLVADAGQRSAIAEGLDLASLDRFEAETQLVPSVSGWTLTGQVKAEGAQTCVVTLDPLPFRLDLPFRIDLVEDGAPEPRELDIDLDRDEPDVIEDGRLDLGSYALEQLALHLDPFPRKPGVEFVQPDEPAEVSPFAILRARNDDQTSGS